MKSRWVVACNGAGSRPWFVCRDDEPEYHNSKNGTLIRYASRRGAQIKADELNRAELGWPILPRLPKPATARLEDA